MRILFSTCFIWIIIHDSCQVKGDCESELGMQNKQLIPDESITASSQLSTNHTPAFARLDSEKGAWCSAPNDTLPYIQILLDKEKSITMIVTQGSSKESRWARKYQIKYLKEGIWSTYQKADGSLTFEGNLGVSSLNEINLQPPIRTRSIRIYPKVTEAVMQNAPRTLNMDNVTCLRLELYGCSAPVNGGWGEWDRWSECSATCGFGMRSRERKCDSPKPQYGGTPCNQVEQVDQERCRKRPCKVIHGGWGKWSHWSECSLTRGIGLTSRERKCDSPEPRNGGRPCNDAERVHTKYCGEINDGFSGSGYGWETYSGGGVGNDDSSGSGDQDGRDAYSKNKISRYNDDEDL